MSNTTAAARAAELHADLESKLLDLVEGDGWATFLRTASRFHTYSAANIMLILKQCPHASRVAGFRAWQSTGRHVKQGEKSIRILAPARYKTTDEATGEERWAVRGFTVAHVFDVSQTEGEPLPDVGPRLLTGEGYADLYAALTAQVWAAGFTVERGDCQGANGFTNYASRTVRVRDDVEPQQAVKTLAHELAHVLLHSPERITYSANRALCEVEAESVAYIVCANAGLVSDDYSLPYVAVWADGDPKVVKATAERVVKTAQSVIDGLSTASGKEPRGPSAAQSIAA